MIEGRLQRLMAHLDDFSRRRPVFMVLVVALAVAIATLGLEAGEPPAIVYQRF